MTPISIRSELPTSARKLNRRFQQWLETQKFELFVTLNFNRDISYQRIRSKLQQLCARLDRRFLG